MTTLFVAVGAAGLLIGWLAGHAMAARRNTRLEAELAAERAASAVRLDAEHEKLSLLQDAENKLREAFASLSAEALRTNSQSFLDLA